MSTASSGPPGEVSRRAASPRDAMFTPDAMSTERLETLIGQTLRIGMYASTVCLAIGLGLSLFTGLDGLAQWLMTAGLVALMATPVARVAATVVEYAVSRDWTFFILTSIVLLELSAGIGAALLLHGRL